MKVWVICRIERLLIDCKWENKNKNVCAIVKR